MSTRTDSLSESSKKTGPSAAGAAPAAPATPEILARLPDFAEIAPSATAPDLPAASTIHHLLDVAVTVSAELGRITLPIGDILKLGVGSVVELERAVADPVDLMVQGIRLARGEVVVVDDHFAIRIKEIADTKKHA